MADDVATTNIDNVSQEAGVDTLLVTNSNQIQSEDFFDGDAGTDIIVVGSNGFTFLNNVTTDATHGFHNYEALTFTDLSAEQSVAIFDAGQFGTGLISTSLVITGSTDLQFVQIEEASNFSAENFVFQNWGAASNVTIYGTSSGDTITGSSLQDTLGGLNGNDTLNGGDAGDFLEGGLGKDTLTGGANLDLFSVTNKAESPRGTNRDVVTDFSGVGGELDRIYLTLMDAKKGPGNQTFKFIGKQPFHDKAGELQVKYNAVTDIAIVQGDINGDGRADFQIEVHSEAALVNADFFL
jgi:Ca2+-binding RTX toxin-like protein